MPTEMPSGGSGATDEFLGIDFARLSIGEATKKVSLMAESDAFQYVVTPNVDHVVMLFPTLDNDRAVQFRAAYRTAALRVCDSRILRALGKLKGTDIATVPGSDLSASLFRDTFRAGHKVAIVGGDADTISSLQRLYAGPDYVQHIPPMGILANRPAIDAVVKFVEDERADFTLFAIGAPQSEIIAHRCAEEKRARGVGVCIGASIEFLLGHKARAPGWMQRSGLEWAFRLVSEPRRLWRRYLVDGPRIFIMVAKWRRQ